MFMVDQDARVVHQHVNAADSCRPRPPARRAAINRVVFGHVEAHRLRADFSSATRAAPASRSRTPITTR